MNLKLYSKQDRFDRSNDVVHQLNFLEGELKNKNLGARMQQEFPEGFVFINALYGLSWCELALDLKSKEIKDRAITEATWAYNCINSKKGKEPFNSYLRPEYGIFYYGWKNYLLAKLLSIHEKECSKDSVLVNEFKVHCDSIASAMRDLDHPYLESYSGGTWPADMFLAVASLQIHDQLFEHKYQDTIRDWIEDVRLNLDPEFGMIPHRVESSTGKEVEGPRGGSMTLMLRLLIEIDPEFAVEQYELFRKNFLTTVMGLPFVREYPKGQFGMGDIDSGPVILGVGPAATIVSIGSLRMLGDLELAERMYVTVNALGLDLSVGDTKRYLAGVLPIADAFIAWANSSHSESFQTQDIPKSNWRLSFQIISVALIVLIWFPFWRNFFRKT